jgi:hypothetical protein
MDHKFAVNVVEPDRKVNSILLERRTMAPEKPPSLVDQIRRRFGMTV